MDADKLDSRLALELGEGFQFTPDQADVMAAYHESGGRVCVGSGAGTGKTTTLTRVVAEAVVRLAGEDLSDLSSNPFNEIIVTTFTKDAAGQLRSEIKSVLRTHQEESDVDIDPALWRWIETDSDISTIDSFVGDLLREVAPEIGVSPRFEIRDEVETEKLLEEIVRTLKEESEYADALEFLNQELTGQYDPSAQQLIYELYGKLRELCYEFPELNGPEETTLLSDSYRQDLYQGREPPFDATDIREITAHLTGQPASDVEWPSDEVQNGIESDYRYSLSYLEAIETLLDAFNHHYDQKTRSSGALSYQDITYLVWSYLTNQEGQAFADALQQQYSHVFIDEFQDTSYAQCQILGQLIGEEPDPAQVLVIGDVKQSIYSWRSADPEIFAGILNHADQDTDDPDPYLETTGWERTELVTNFRSHPQLVRAGNQLFSEVFADPGRGGIGTFPVEHGPLIPKREATRQLEPHLHVIPLGECERKDPWEERGPERIAAALRGMIDAEDTYIDDGDEGTRLARPGDITLLFRRGTRMAEFRSALKQYGFSSAVLAEDGLFKSDEIRFVIDVLEWFANPHSKQSLLRLLRSPVAALSDETLRFLASKRLNLGWALDGWPDDELPARDYQRLSALVDLRSDVRWDREGSKAALVQKIIQHTAVETVLLGGDDAVQRYGNLWMLVEVVRDWEDDELLPYREFVDRLHRYRKRALNGEETVPVAPAADSQSTETIKLRTVHSSKGLEFSIVVLADLLASWGRPIKFADRMEFRTAADEFTLGLQPRPAGEPVSHADGPGSSWSRPDNSSTVWVSGARDTGTGRPAYDHPYNAGWRDEVAEYWRLLYVAFTRASDHLVISLPDTVPDYYRWSSWAKPINDAYQGRVNWGNISGQTRQLALSRGAQHPDDDALPETIPLGVGSLPTGEKRPTASLGIPSARETTAGTTRTNDRESFTPRELRPSSLYDLHACPRRYQYRALESVSEARGKSPPGTNAPNGLSPSAWGTIVHQAFDALHTDVSTGQLDAADGYLAAYREANSDVVEALNPLISTYRETALWDTVQDSMTVLPEYDLSAKHPGSPPTHISGQVDLLYETDNGWAIADFKTGTVPRADSFLTAQYKKQLTTYAWLLDKEYDIEVEAAALVYVQSGEEHEVATDIDGFTADLSELPETTNIVAGEGLPTDPDPNPAATTANELNLESRCGSCPYTSICPEW